MTGRLFTLIHRWFPSTEQYVRGKYRCNSSTAGDLSIFLFSTALLLISFSLSPVYAQPVNFQSLTADDGLSQNTINDILKDSLGFVWIATQEGLNRYNGKNFRIYKKNEQHPEQGPPGNWISALANAPGARLWVGTHSNGLSCFNMKTKTFSKIPDSLLQGSRISNLTSIDSTLYVGFQDGGVVKLQFLKDGKYSSTQTVIPVQFNDQRVVINELLPLFDNSILAVSQSHGVFLVDLSTQKMKLLPVNLRDSPQAPPTFTTVTKLRDGQIVFGTDTRGIWKYDTSLKQIVPHSSALSQAVKNSRISFITEHQQSLWVGTNGDGLYRNLNDGRIDHIHENNHGEYGITDNTFYTVYNDTEGVLWFGTYVGGLVWLNPDMNRFINFKHSSDNPSSLNNNYVRGFQEHNGKLYIAGRGGGISILDLKTYQFDQQTEKQFNNLLPSDLTNDIYIDTRGNFWIATWGKGALRISSDFSRVTRYDTQQPKARRLFNNYVRLLYEDQQGRIWIATGQSGSGALNVIDQNSGQNLLIENQQNGDSGFQINDVKQIAENEYLFASYHGLSRLRVSPSRSLMNSNFTLSHFPHDPADSNSVSGNIISSIYQESDSVFWVSVYGEGINRVRLTDDGVKAKHYNESQGLNVDGVFSVIGDKNGHLWLSTNRGIVRMDNHWQIFDRYTKADGLASNQFNQGAYYRLNNGDLVFGGINGITLFDPAKINPPLFSPPIYLSEINVLGEPYMANVAPAFIKEIDLGPDQNFVSFEFNALSYRAPDQINYEYQLSPFNKRWMASGNRNFVNFTNLPHGEYTFKVRAADNFGNISPNILSIPVTVSPPFYRTIPFLIFTIMFVTLSIVGWNRYRERRLRTLNKELEEHVEARTRDLEQKTQELEIKTHEAEQANQAKSNFLAGMSHELRTPLNAILGFSQILNRADELPERYRTYAETMYRSGNHLLGMINDVLDISKIEAGRMDIKPSTVNLYQLIEDIQHMFSLQCQGKNLEYTVYSDNHLPEHIELDNSKFRQVIINLVGNAVKFTDSGFIRIRFKQILEQELPSHQFVHNRISVDESTSLLYIEVKDSGNGVEPDRLSEIFQPFQQQDLEESSSGTGLGLSISSRIVQMMDGTIMATSEPGKGSVFAFCIPLIESDVSSVEEIKKDKKRKLSTKWFGTNVLIVDDIKSNLQVLESIMEEAGFSPIAALSAKDGLELFEEHKPPIILLDLRMPGMNGTEMMEVLRRTHTDLDLAIIAVTASILDENMDDLRNRGFDEVLIKPFKQSDLYNAIERFSDVEFVGQKSNQKHQDQTQHATTTGSAPDIAHLLKPLSEEQTEQFKELVIMTDLEELGEWIYKQGISSDPSWEFVLQQVEKKNYRYFLSLSDELDDTDES